MPAHCSHRHGMQGEGSRQQQERPEGITDEAQGHAWEVAHGVCHLPGAGFPRGQIKCHLTQPWQRRRIVLVFSDVKVELKHSRESIGAIVVSHMRLALQSSLQTEFQCAAAGTSEGHSVLQVLSAEFDALKTQALLHRSTDRSGGRQAAPPQSSRRRASQCLCLPARRWPHGISSLHSKSMVSVSGATQILTRKPLTAIFA